jgi:hypothetical protein
MLENRIRSQSNDVKLIGVFKPASRRDWVPELIGQNKDEISECLNNKFTANLFLMSTMIQLVRNMT